jgi:thioredoxin reductase (NADPH)
VKRATKVTKPVATATTPRREARAPVLDLLVVGAGPTALAVGVDALRAGLSVLLVERGALTDAILHFPTHMTFFTTRDLLEIAGVPFAIPEDKPDRRQALAYYRAVAALHRVPLALHEEVLSARLRRGVFHVETRTVAGVASRRARNIVLATGYFGDPKRLQVPGEALPWVRSRYREAHFHFGERVVVVGGGNSAVETALDLWRGGAKVTLVHRGAAVKPTVKYWLRPDFENRVAEGTIAARLGARVTRFAGAAPGRVEIEVGGVREVLEAEAAYVLVGYRPDVDFERRCGIAVDPETLVPTHDPETGETNVPGLYVAGTLQAGRDTGKIFIENSREHGQRIVRHLIASRRYAACSSR